MGGKDGSPGGGHVGGMWWRWPLFVVLLFSFPVAIIALGYLLDGLRR